MALPSTGQWVLVSFILHIAVGIEFTRSLVFTNDPNDLSKNAEMSWGYNSTHIEIQLSYPCLGWIAMAQSPNGGMDQSDVLFGYVNDTTGEATIQDRYLTANGISHSINLTLENQQDWRTVSGSKNTTHTVLRAARKLQTCDSMDRPFTNAVTYVLFSWNYKLPESPSAKIRMHNVRGKTSINFLQLEELPEPDISKEISQILEFRVDNQTVTGDADTHYFCKMVTLPHFDRKYQSIASQPIVNPKNINVIHHMLLYMCAKLPEEHNNIDFFECGPNAPPSGNIVMKYCQTVIGVWAMGAKPTIYMPTNVGLPFTPDMSNLKVALQVHYNNPQRLTFTDDSGMRFLLTDKIREHDSGSLMAGILSLDFLLTMPPGQPNFHVQGQCSDQCTASMLPADGITIFSSFVHMHTRGKNGVARHFRGSEEILPPLGIEEDYDFNFQRTKPLIPFRKFLPGDRVIVECNFTTANESRPIYGGEGTGEEMCLVFLDYYPKTDLNMCGSHFRLSPYLKTLGMNSQKLMKEGGLPQMRSDVADQMVSTDEGSLRKRMIDTLKGPVSKYMTDKRWSPADVNMLQDFYSQPSIGICNGKYNRSRIYNDRPPQVGFYVDSTKQGC